MLVRILAGNVTLREVYAHTFDDSPKVSSIVTSRFLLSRIMAKIY